MFRSVTRYDRSNWISDPEISHFLPSGWASNSFTLTYPWVFYSFFVLTVEDNFIKQLKTFYKNISPNVIISNVYARKVSSLLI